MPSLAGIGSCARGRWTQDEVFPSMKDVGPFPEERMLVHYRSEMVGLSPRGPPAVMSGGCSLTVNV